MLVHFNTLDSCLNDLINWFELRSILNLKSITELAERLVPSRKQLFCIDTSIVDKQSNAGYSNAMYSCSTVQSEHLKV